MSSYVTPVIGEAVVEMSSDQSAGAMDGPGSPA